MYPVRFAVVLWMGVVVKRDPHAANLGAVGQGGSAVETGVVTMTKHAAETNVRVASVEYRLSDLRYGFLGCVAGNSCVQDQCISSGMLHLQQPSWTAWLTNPSQF
jgi:hypothetical protein